VEAPATVSVSEDRIKIEPEWKKLLLPEFEKRYMIELRRFLAAEMKAGKIIYPEGKNIFNALNTTPLSKVKVVILGQDPYHGPGQAHGLCFSVQRGVPPPPSLQNIFKELKADLGFEPPSSGELTKWAEQGVLLLNTCLTVENGKPLSHQSRGWESFTDRVIQILNEQERPLVFFLWGSPAQRKEILITNPKHLILKSPHPSPLSAHRGFLGCKAFSKANQYLTETGQEPIDWSLS
jgi:uracil-DNA glycosylase